MDSVRAVACVLLLLQSLDQIHGNNPLRRIRRDDTYSPTVTFEQEVYYAAIGDQVTMVAHIDANPLTGSTGITAADGISIFKDRGNVSLSFDSVKEDNFKDYTVTFNNGVGSGSGTCTLEDVVNWDGYPTMPFPSWNPNEIEVDEGTNLVMSCIVNSTNAEDVIQVVKIGPYPRSEYAATIALNEEIMSPFNDTGRYTVTRTYQDGITTLDLSYSGIQAEDADMLICHVVSDDVYVSKAKANLQIRVPVEMSLSFNNTDITDGGVISYVEGEDPEWVRCEAKVDGSLEVPVAWMSLGGVNLTNTFDSSSTVSSTDPLGQRTASATVIYTPGFTPSYEHNGDTLICQTEEVAVSATVEIKFSPRLTCPSNEYRLVISEPFEIICNATANPGDLELELLLMSGNSTGMMLLQEAQEADVTTITLKSESFQAVNLGTYAIRVANYLGEDRFSLTFNQDVSTGVAFKADIYRILLALALTYITLRHYR